MRDITDDLIQLQNEYRALLVRARSAKRMNNGLPSQEEGQFYMRASEICGKIANLTTGATSVHWAEKQQECDAMIREIAFALDPAAAKAAAKAGSGRSAAPSADADKPNAGSLEAGDEDISAETIQRWFEYPLDHGFDKVAGMEDLKTLLRDCVAAAGMSKLNERMRMSKCRSYFFYGLPGCGKTYIVEAFAYELKKQGYTFMSLTGGQIHSQWQGIAEKTIEKAFQLAEEKAPTIIFIDEIESVCRSRKEGNQAAHVQQTTTAFLNAYNRMKKCDKQIIFIGATNYPSLVDTAMMDRVVPVEVRLPDLGALSHKFEHALDGIIELDSDVTFDRMATECLGYNYRDVEHLLDVLKDNIIRDIRQLYNNDDDAAAAALENGDYRLDWAMFMDALDNPASKPSEKAALVEELQAWQHKVLNNQE